jgi:pimeloyl-ACP methyl ester carboxylesterase
MDKLITKLDLRDIALAGFSMGGGEVARYLGKHGSQRVSRAIFISSVPPFLVKTPDNPEGVDRSVFEGIKQAIASDRPAFLSKFFADFYNVDVLRGKRISDQAIQLSWNIGAVASPKGTLDCVSAWLTDFRKDLQSIKVPTLVIHGDADRILPIAATGKRTHELVKGSKFVVVEGGPHGITWTHAEQVNQALIQFLGEKKSAGRDNKEVAA